MSKFVEPYDTELCLLSVYARNMPILTSLQREFFFRRVNELLWHYKELVGHDLTRDTLNAMSRLNHS